MKTKLFLLALTFTAFGCNLNNPNVPGNSEVQKEGKHQGYDYVDLGLPSGTKWATCNIGAEKPWESGDYFAFGEVETKKYYNKYNHIWYDSVSDQLTKYCTDSDEGIVDNKTILDLSDDVAHVKWGGKWRIPTKNEFDELRTRCIWAWIENNGVEGYSVVGLNGNSIFLPAAGEYYKEVEFYNRYGFYRTSQLDTVECLGGWCVHYLILEEERITWSGDSRPWGLPTRPVFNP